MVIKIKNYKAHTFFVLYLPPKQVETDFIQASLLLLIDSR